MGAKERDAPMDGGHRGFVCGAGWIGAAARWQGVLVRVVAGAEKDE